MNPLKNRQDWNWQGARRRGRTQQIRKRTVFEQAERSGKERRKVSVQESHTEVLHKCRTFRMERNDVFFCLYERSQLVKQS